MELGVRGGHKLEKIDTEIQTTWLQERIGLARRDHAALENAGRGRNFG